MFAVFFLVLLLLNFSLTFSDLVLPDAWISLHYEKATEHIYLEKVSASTDPVITKSFTVNNDGTWTIRVAGHVLETPPFPVAKHLDTASTQRVLDHLDKLYYCIGNYEKKYLELCTAEGRIGNTAYLDRQGLMVNQTYYKGTIRSNECKLLVDWPSKCPPCLKTFGSLRSMKSRKQNVNDDNRTAVTSRTNFVSLNKEALMERCRNMSRAYKTLKQRSSRLQASLEKITNQEGTDLGSSTTTSFKQIIKEYDTDITSKYKEGTFGHLFWTQQRDAANSQDRKGHRWHPMFIKWCINLKLTSSKCYRVLRESKVLELPCDTTLRNYIHWTRPLSGLHFSSIQQLMREIKYEERTDYQKYVVIVHDEMKIKEDLVYQKSTGRLVGFTDLGDVQNQLRTFEQRLSKETQPESDLASHMFVVMVRGLFWNFTYPLAHYPTSKTSSDEIFALVWQSIEWLEMSGLKVVAVTCDGAATNRRFNDIHGTQQGTHAHPIFKTPNPYAKDRDIFLMQDPPHLVKCVRNTWANSYANQKTRTLWVRIL